MDKAKILELARKQAECEQRIQHMGMMNTPTNYEDRVKSDALYQLAHDAAAVARRAYQDAIKGLTSDELSELARGESGECEHDWTALARSPRGGIDGTCTKCGTRTNVPG